MAPGKLPGCSGSRNLHDNTSDLRAQVAANQKVSASAYKEHIEPVNNIFIVSSS